MKKAKKLLGLFEKTMHILFAACDTAAGRAFWEYFQAMSQES